MGNLSENFSRYEFACNCGCGFNTVDAELLPVTQDVRDHFGVSVFISSGCRCLSYNKAIGGAKRSRHMWGQANDIQVSGVKPRKVADYLEKKYPGKFGIGRYKTFTHVDIRANPARWGNN